MTWKSVGAAVCLAVLSSVTGCSYEMTSAETGTGISRDVQEARDGFLETPGMSELFDDLYGQGIGTTVNEVFALGIYIPGFCETRAQQGLSEEEAVAEVTDSLGATYEKGTGEPWAEPIVQAAEQHVCD
ncbi:hypothetical protein [Rhodococcus sp. 14-2483-1-1]|uniref:hypothetical protein n=1 Tax=Rhodococcus sp. 14-2483-1-1 TaxID=2023148 RepID=UPI0011401971|nr:hypothetical protein [Rhodococcus sp. 14-2483-1-1]